MNLKKGAAQVQVDECWSTRISGPPQHVLLQVGIECDGGDEWNFITLTARESRRIAKALVESEKPHG